MEVLRYEIEVQDTPTSVEVEIYFAASQETRMYRSTVVLGTMVSAQTENSSLPL